MNPLALLTDYRTEVERLTAENHRLRIECAELRGANAALHKIIADLRRRRLADVYAEKVRLLVGADHG